MMKRPAVPLGDERSEEATSAKRQRQLQTAEPSHESPLTFLKLPIEIRGLILRELLWWPEPIDFQSKLPWAAFTTRNPLHGPKLFTNIIATCQQLNEEGSRILYANTIACRAWSKWPVRNDGHNDPYMFPYALSPVYSIRETNQLPSAVRERISRVHIEVTAGSCSMQDLHLLQAQVRIIARLLKETPAWKHLSVSLIFDKARASERPGFDQVLNPLLYIRHRDAVHIVGLSSSEFTGQLITLMTSSRPAVDLDEMYTAISAYALAVTSGGRVESRMDSSSFEGMIHRLREGELVKARNSNNVGAFCKQRRRLMVLISAYIMHQQAAAFDCDPVEWQYESKLVMRNALGSGVTDKSHEVSQETRDVLVELAAEGEWL